MRAIYFERDPNNILSSLVTELTRQMNAGNVAPYFSAFWAGLNPNCRAKEKRREKTLKYKIRGKFIIFSDRSGVFCYVFLGKNIGDESLAK